MIPSILDPPVTSLLASDSYSPRTLRSELKSRGELPTGEVIALGLKLTAALAHLHAAGLVHRDVKPSNILFIGGEPKLADAGLVAAVDDARSLVGTAGYIAPEGPGTPSADLYALGKVLYEVAFGKDRQEFPALPADVASRPDHARLLELNEIIASACAHDPQKRYATAEAIRADLQRLERGKSVKRQRAWRQVGRLAVRLGAAVAVVIAAWFAFSRFNSSTTQWANALKTPTVAVLPFDEEGAAGDDLGERLTEEIRLGLSRVPGLGVIGRASSEALKKGGRALAMARSNKISSVLEGRLRRHGDQVRLSLELNDTASGRMLWTESLESPVADPFVLQIAVVERVPAALNIPLTDTQLLRLVTRPTRSLEAYRADFETAVKQLRMAVELDPGFALAWAELANADGVVAEAPNHSAKEPLLLAQAAGHKAFELVPRQQ